MYTGNPGLGLRPGKSNERLVRLPAVHAFFSSSRPASVLAHSCVTERSPGLRSPFWRLFASLQGFLGQFELRTLSVRKLWVLQVHALQSVHDDVGDGQMREPLVICLLYTSPSPRDR